MSRSLRYVTISGKHLFRRGGVWLWRWFDEIQRWRHGHVSRAGARLAVRRAFAERIQLEAWSRPERSVGGIRYYVAPLPFSLRRAA